MTAHPHALARRLVGLSSSAAVPVIVLLAAACGSVRPYVRPLPGAPTDTLPVEASQLINLLGGVLVGEGLRLRVVSPEEGYLETEWYDLEQQRPVSERTRTPHTVIRFRFFADPLSEEETVLISEGVYRLTLDPSVPEREREVLVTGDHPGQEMLERIWSTVRLLQESIGG
jgi:hypothetical protein